MRVVLMGASELTLNIARMLLDRDHDVVVIEKSKQCIDEIQESYDVGFLHGSGSHPDILREAQPERSDVLVCLSDDDDDNLLAALVGRSLGFKRVVPTIRDPEFLPICEELGLEDVVLPNQTMARHVVDMVVAGADVDLSAFIGGGVRFFSFEVAEGGAASCKDLDLPDDTRPLVVQCGDSSALVDEDTRLKPGDRVLLVTRTEHLGDLRRRYPARHVRERGKDRAATEERRGR